MIYLLIYLKFLIRFGYIQVILGIDLKELLVVLGAFLKIGDASMVGLLGLFRHLLLMQLGVSTRSC